MSEMQINYSCKVKVPLSVYEEICKTKKFKCSFWGIGDILIEFSDEPRLISLSKSGAVIEIHSNDKPYNADFYWCNQQFCKALNEREKDYDAIKKVILDNIPYDVTELEKYIKEHNFGSDILKMAKEREKRFNSSIERIRKYLNVGGDNK